MRNTLLARIRGHLCAGRTRIAVSNLALILAACGGGGGSETSGVTPPVDLVAPSVAITAPAANATLDGQVSITASATDDVGVAGVQFRLDGTALGDEDTSAPYSVAWSTSSVANGGHTLTAVARDAAGNQALSAAVNVTVSNGAADMTPPTVSLTAPANSATLAGTVTVSANATDDVAVIGVQFLLDGAALKGEDLNSPYSISWDTTGASQGAHVLSAVARDAAGNQKTSASVNVTVNNVPPPSGSAISVGQIVVDPPTLETLGVSLPITSGDTNHNATVNVSYRRAGDANWLSALPLMRVRPELLSQEDPTSFDVAEQFAGSIFDLTPDTEYEIMLDVQDPDGGSTTRTATARTRAMPLANPIAPRAVAVSTLSQLNTALSNAQPGDVITLANGTYNGAIALSRSGNASNPIFIRGASRDGVVINASGASAGIAVTGSYVTIENLTIQNSSWGMHLNAQGNTSSNIVVRRLKITGVSYGIYAKTGEKHDYYICDNVLEGQVQWPKTDNSVWDFEGIVVAGAGHVVCYNTLSGFGDALGLSKDTDIPNRAIDFYGNDVVWTGDNGVELDFSERNVRFFRNRVTNGGNHSISFQPVYGGPAYAFRNVIYNSAFSPYKFNNDPTGLVVLHNTALRPGVAWWQSGGRADNIIFENNLSIGTDQPVDISTDFSLAQIDYNGWWRDGTFSFAEGSWGSFASLQSNSPYEHNGRLLNGMPFATPVTFAPDYTTKVAPVDVSLSAASNAVDGGVRLPNINDGFAGANPDLGAIELGSPPQHYGVR